MMMTLLLMGAQGSAMIVAVLMLRALLLDHLPKATFCALWALVAARLLVPLFVTSPLGLWGLASHLQPRGVGGGEALGAAGTTAASGGLPSSMDTAAATPDASASPTEAPTPAGVSPLPVPTEQAAAPPQATPVDLAMLDPNSGPATPADLLSTLPWWAWAWIAGSALCLLGFAVLYLHGRLRFKASAPVSCPQAVQWLQEHPLRRPLSIRCCAAVSAPLTYGVLHPVILVPPAFD